VLHGLLRRQNQSKNVDIEHSMKMGFGDVADGCKFEDPRIVDENVNPAEVGDRRADQRLSLRSLGDVPPNRDGLSALGDDLVNYRICPGFAGGVIYDHRSAFCRE
jgi:hypothetical protein